MKPETKYKGSIKLSAIGDALGWITEFEKSTDSIKNKFGTEKVEKFYSWEKNVGGHFYGFRDSIRAGSYSDDTQLMLAVARSIKKGGASDHNYFAKIELVNWLDYARGGGRTVKTAAGKISRKSVSWFNNFYNYKVNGEVLNYKESGANGAAMRVLPIALANLGDIEKIKEEIFCNSIVTHGHPRAILGAMIYGYAVNQIITIRPENFNWENYLTQIGLDFPQKFEITFRNRKEINEWLRQWNTGSGRPFEAIYAETVAEAQNQLRYIFKSIKEDHPVTETLKNIGCFATATKGSGISTVIAGIYLSVKFNDRPIEAILQSVNALGADTDSIAAFTGGLIGALHGQGIIPDKWKSVQDMRYLDKIAERLLSISEDTLEEEHSISSSNHKRINNFQTDDFQIGEAVEFEPLGPGKITFIDRQPTLTKGKYNLLIEVDLENGQSILVSKLLEGGDLARTAEMDENAELISLAANKLKPKTLEKFKQYIDRNKKIPKAQTDVIRLLLINEE